MVPRTVVLPTLAGLLLLLSVHPEPAMSIDSPPVRTPDRPAITNTVVGMLHAIDARDWTAVRVAFADTVTTDYTSLFGGEAQTQPADSLLDGWDDFLPGFDATQHLAGPLVVAIEGNTAQVRCAITAKHRIDEALWTVGGHYQIQLAKTNGDWYITHLTLHTAYQDGDRSLPEKAAERDS